MLPKDGMCNMRSTFSSAMSLLTLLHLSQEYKKYFKWAWSD